MYSLMRPSQRVVRTSRGAVCRDGLSVVVLPVRAAAVSESRFLLIATVPGVGISASDPWSGPVDGHHDKAVNACRATGAVRVEASTARRAVRWVGRVGGHSVFAGC